MSEVVACLATIPSRSKQLKLVCESLLPQVDRLFIYFNKYEDSDVPLWAKSMGKIEYETSSSGNYGDLGDVGKFYFCSEEMKDKYKINDVVLTCDDDIIYPEWYAQKTVDLIRGEYIGKLISYHGSVILRRNISYHNSRSRRSYLVKDTVYRPVPVHVGGTGCMCFETTTFRPSLSMFIHTNMSDIFVAKWASNNNVPIVVIPHTRGDFKILDVPETIYENSRDETGSSMDRQRQTGDVLRSIRWKVLRM